MKKEVLFSIFIGICFGIAIAFGIYRANLEPEDINPQDIKDDQKQEPTKTEQVNPNNLSIISPEDGLVQAEKSIKVVGTTSPNNYIVIFVNDEETITSADETGNFSVDVELLDGSNIIEVHAINQDGITSNISHTVIISDDIVEETIDNENDFN
jgi:hypothetical protein